MNPEDPRDIKCPQCEHRIPLDVEAGQVEKIICPLCKTLIENIEDSIVPSSSPVSELPDKQDTDIGIALNDLIQDNASENEIDLADVATNSSESEMPAKEIKDVNLDLPELIQGDMGESRSNDENPQLVPDFTKFGKTTDLDFDQDFVDRQQEIAHEFAVAQSQIVNWDESQPSEGPVSSKFSKIKLIRFGSLVTILIAAVLFIAFKGKNKNQNNNITFNFAEENEQEKEIKKEPETISELLLEVGAKELHLMATNALKSFLDAKDVKSRIQYCREPQRVRPLMESYYAKHNPGPISYRKLSTVGDTETGPLNEFYLLKISFVDFSIRPVVMGFENGKMVIDWESFVGYSEMSLNEFIDNRPTGPTMFRLHARSDDYFNFQFNEKDHRCLYLRNPKDTESVYGYIQKGSAVDDKLSAIIESGKSINFIIVNLQYPEELGGKNQVLIDEIIASGWLLTKNN